MNRSDEPSPIRTCVIGSFRQHYEDVLAAVQAFQACGLEVLSPAVSIIVNPGDEFVRFASDPVTSENAEIQLEALRNIFASDFVFVVAPDGYIGRTTCYEIGAIQAAGIPLFFSAPPLDLPISVSKDAIASAAALAREVVASGAVPRTEVDDVEMNLSGLLADAGRVGRDRQDALGCPS